MRPVQEAESISDSLKEVLSIYEISIDSGSPLEEAMSLIKEWQKAVNEHGLRAFEDDSREKTRKQLGFLHFAETIVNAERWGRLEQFSKHVKRLGKVDPNLVAIPSQDENTHKMFELLVALACDDEFGNAELDDPDHPSGLNPDVMFRADGQLWGLACKSQSSSSPLTLADNIKKAVGQIQNSPVDIGFPLIFFRNFPHDQLWHGPDGIENPVTLSASIDHDYWIPKMKAFIEDSFRAVRAREGESDFRSVFQSTKTPPYALGIAQSVASYVKPAGASTGTVIAGCTFGFSGVGVALEMDVLNRLTGALLRPGQSIKTVTHSVNSPVLKYI